MSKLIFGCGYLGHRVARRWLADGDAVYAVTRSQHRAAELAERGLRPVVADITRPDTLRDLPIADTVLFAVGFDRAAGHAIYEVYANGLRHVLHALPVASGPVIYISSTGVYSQNDGSWVDEDSPCEPDREGGRACLAAEQILRAHPRGADATILRLAGIYGPGRIPRIADIRAGKPLPAPSEGFLNLIHVDDAADIVVAAARARVAGQQIYTVTDGHPVERRVYFQEAARLAGAPPPRFDEGLASDAKRARGTTSKRVRNDRMLRELAVTLRYPTFRDGLAATFAEEERKIP